MQAQLPVSFNVNNISTKITNTLSPFYNSSLGASNYEVGLNSGIKPIFNTGLWLGALDNNNSLYLSIHKEFSGNHFGFGPIATNFNTLNFQYYNKVWKVTSQEIWAHQQGVNTSSSIMTWPAHGDVSNGEAFY